MVAHESFGVVSHDGVSRRTDYLYRLSLKCLVRNERGDVLVVQEAGRGYWDLPGGGMDHGENIKTAIAREMKEEVNLEGRFAYTIIAVDEPAYLSNHHFWQLRLIFAVRPQHMIFSAGDDSDQVTFKDPASFKSSDSLAEQRVYTYSQLLD